MVGIGGIPVVRCLIDHERASEEGITESFTDLIFGFLMSFYIWCPIFNSLGQLNQN